MKSWWFGFLLLGCGAASSTSAPPRETTSKPAKAVTPQAFADESGGVLPIGKDDPTWGSRTAPVTIVEFGDFQCPFCGKAATTLSALKEAYGPEKLRVIWKNNPLPFHPSARRLAEAAQGVFALGGADAFWAFHEQAYRVAAASEEVSDEQLSALLGGVDRRKLMSGLQQKVWAAKVDEDIKTATAVGATGTPYFFINGTLIAGAHSIEKFRDVIDQEALKAKALAKAGVAPDRIYLTMTATNRAESAKEEDEDEAKPVDPVRDTTLYKVPLTSPLLSTGPADALVTIVEFGDFECPFTRKAEPTLQKLLHEKYPRDVRLVWKHHPLPFHSHSVDASKLSLEARSKLGDKGFWAVHDKLLAKSGSLSDSDLTGVAQELKFEFKPSSKNSRVIEADQDVADDFDVTGTPTFFINGRRITGTQSEDVFTQIIDQELARARAAGVKGPNAYDTLVKDGKGPKELEKKTVDAAPGAPAQGSAKAPVTIVEFSDFQCPYCEKVNPTISGLMHDYPGRVRRVFRHLPLPFHKQAHLAAEASMEAFKQKGSDGFFKMHDLLFQNQSGLERADLDRYASQIGLDMRQFAEALDQGKHRDAVDADAAAAHKAGILGTPAFVINGYYVVGAQQPRKFKRVIDKALAEAGRR